MNIIGRTRLFFSEVTLSTRLKMILFVALPSCCSISPACSVLHAGSFVGSSRSQLIVSQSTYRSFDFDNGKFSVFRAHTKERSKKWGLGNFFESPFSLTMSRCWPRMFFFKCVACIGRFVEWYFSLFDADFIVLRPLVLDTPESMATERRRRASEGLRRAKWSCETLTRWQWDYS